MLTATLRASDLRLPKVAREHWIGTAILAIAAMLYLVAGISVNAFGAVDGRAQAQPGAAVAAKAVPALPGTEPVAYKAVTPTDAVAFNASVPVSSLSNPAARAFLLRAAGEDRARALECLTAAVYYEAATEPLDGQRAVAQVVLNRVRHPAFPASVCGVVFQGAERSTGCQFTFTCDGSIARAPASSYWARARSVAEAALAGYVHKPVGLATHYHTNWVVPYWASSLVKLANVGTHIFYRWEGGWGRPGAFSNRQSANEPLLPKMAYIGFGTLPAATAAGAALAEAKLVEEAKAGAPALADRAVVRRFEAVKREDVATVVAKQTKPGEAVSEAYRWAMMGGTSGEAFGKKPEPAASPTKAVE
jgi:spore germination cell wall hydrolase CwlJ-like protein